MNKYYIGAAELMELGFGRKRAYELLKQVRTELEAKGFFLPSGAKAPRQAVLKKMGIKELVVNE